MSAMNPVEENLPTILCCLCGASIQSNAANMCVNCLKTQVDITEGISKQVIILMCKGCGRYQKPPWVAAQLESRELLAVCLKKIKGLNKVKLVDASFIWTEPHSRRIKVKLKVQKEVFNGAIMQQVFVVEFVVQTMQCPDCAKSYTEHVWNTVIQCRQKVPHKRTFYYLEQLLIKYDVLKTSMGVKEMPDGLDFYWGSKSEAQKMVQFLQSVVPMRFTNSRRLISQDDHSNVKKYKFTYNVEIAPICKDDIVALDPKLASVLGGVSPLMLCYRVSNTMHFVDPIGLSIVEISEKQFFRYPFKSILGCKQFVEFFVLDVELADERTGNAQNKKSKLNSMMAMAEVTVARSSDFGKNDQQFTCITHLGHLLHAGDTCLGYDLTVHNILETEIKILKGRALPDVVLVRKSYKKKNRAERRRFRLQKLRMEREERKKKAEQERDERDYEEFMRDVEEDPHMQRKIDMYAKDQVTKGKTAMASDDDDDEDELPEVEDLLESFKFTSEVTPGVSKKAIADQTLGAMDEDEEKM